MNTYEHPLRKYLVEAIDEMRRRGIEHSDFAQGINSLCSQKNYEYADLFNALHIAQKGSLVIFRYKSFIQLSDLGYSPATFWELYDGLFLECRSVVFDIDTLEVVLLPQTKFKNMGEDDKQWSEKSIRKKIKNAALVEFSNKLDGSNQNFRWYKGRVIGAGSQEIDEEKSWRLSDGYKYINEPAYINLLKDHPDCTFMFEYISLRNHIVVDYSIEQEGLYLFGCRNNATGKETPYSEILRLSRLYGVRATSTEETTLDGIISQLDDYKAEEKEGWVVAIWDNEGNVFKAKVKVNDYVSLHRTVQGELSPNGVIKAIADNQYDDLYARLPKNQRLVADDFVKTILSYQSLITSLIFRHEKLMKQESFPSKREAMQWITSNVPQLIQGYIINIYLGKEVNVLKTSTSYVKYSELIRREEQLRIQENNR